MKKLVIMAGLSGSGKSTIAKKRYPGLKIVDCDELKKQCKGYDPAHPELVHEESKRLEKLALSAAVCGDQSFIYDTTATNTERVVSLIKEAQAFGFTVEICYVKVSLQTALNRNANRARKVPEYIIREKNEIMAQSLEIIAGYADKMITINND